MSVIFIDKCKAEDKYIEDLEECLDYEVPKSGGPAAIIIEPIQGANSKFPQLTQKFLNILTLIL